MKRLFRNISIILIISLFLIVGVISLHSQDKTAEEKGYEIMKKVDSAPEPKNQIASQYMVIQKGSNKYTKLFDIYSKKVDENFSKSLVEFTYPAKVKILSWSYKDKDDEIWVKMASGSARKMTGSEKEGDYMGSHITYEDLEEYDFEAFTYTYKGEGKVNGELHYLIETTKKDGKWLYSKTRNYVRAKDYLVTNMECFDKDNKKIKRMQIQYEEIKGYKIPSVIKMELIGQEDQWTAFGINKDDNGKFKLEVDVSEDKLPDSMFSKDSL